MNDLTVEHIIDLWESLPAPTIGKIQVTTLADKVYVFDRTVFVHPAYLKQLGIEPGKARHQGVRVQYDQDATRLIERSGYRVELGAGTWMTTEEATYGVD